MSAGVLQDKTNTLNNGLVDTEETIDQCNWWKEGKQRQKNQAEQEVGGESVSDNTLVATSNSEITSGLDCFRASLSSPSSTSDPQLELLNRGPSTDTHSSFLSESKFENNKHPCKNTYDFLDRAEEEDYNPEIEYKDIPIAVGPTQFSKENMELNSLSAMLL